MTALLAGYRVTYLLALKKLELLAPRAFFVETSYGRQNRRKINHNLYYHKAYGI